MRPSPHRIHTDALVIGAGPVGLYLVFQLGLLGIHCTVVDARFEAGGQPAALYPDKPIYDLPGIPSCTGAELTQRLRTQVQPFAPHTIWGQQVVSCEPLPEGGWLLGTEPASHAQGNNPGVPIQARTVFLAAGVGAFVPKRLGSTCLTPWEGSQVHYHPSAQVVADAQRTLVVGGDSVAAEAAIHLARTGRTPIPVTLLHRRNHWDWDAAVQTEVQALEAQGLLQRVVGQILEAESVGDRLTGVRIQQPDASWLHLPLDQVLVYLGLSPRLGPLTQWGMALDRKLLKVDPATCATDLPGMYAVGDVVTYPGKKKLLVSGFHECVQAAFSAAQHLHPDVPPALEYTSSSTKLQRRLGVA